MHEPAGDREPGHTRVLRKEPTSSNNLNRPAEHDGQLRRAITAETIRSGTAVGAKLLSYELEELVGCGGMGTVYKARHSWLGRTVAIKFIATQVMNDPEAVTRFKCEARAVGALDSPHIVRATDAGQHHGICFLVTDFVEGEDAARLVARRGPLSAADASQIIMQAALGLQHAHEQGLIHRDVKPSNLLIDHQGTVKLIDFGIARLAADRTAITSAGQVLGTFDFLAPEQASDAHAIDIRADIYGLGCTFYYLLMGTPPFSGPKYSSAAAKIKGHIVDSPPPLVGMRGPLPRGVAACVERMLAKSPHDRFSEPAEIAELLAPYAQAACLERLTSNELCYGLASSAEPNAAVNQTWNQRLHHALVEGPRAAERLVRWAWPHNNASAAQRRRRPLALAGVVAAVSLFGSVLALQRHDSPHPPETVATTDVVHGTAAETRTADIEERPALQPQVGRAAREQSPARTTFDRAAELAPAANTTITTRPANSPPQHPASPAPPRATVRTLARPVSHGTRMMAPVTVTADDDDSARTPSRNQPSGWTAFPSGKKSGGGMEYRVIKSGTGPQGFDPRMLPPGFDPTRPPPGFDPSKLPPLPEGAMHPPWIVNQIPPAPGADGR